MKVSFALLTMLIIGGAVLPATATASTASATHKPHKVKKHKAPKHHNS